MKYSKSLVVICFCFSGVFSGEIITSPPVTNWGAWNPFQHCPEGTLAKGFQLLVQPSQGIIIDDTALNGVKLFCGYPTDIETVNITSGVGIHGTWGRVFSCGGGYVYGFQLRVEHNGIDDETATNNVRIFCTNAEPEVFIEGDGTTWGTWGDVKKCARTQGFCGIQTQIQPDQGLIGKYR